MFGFGGFGPSFGSALIQLLINNQKQAEHPLLELGSKSGSGSSAGGSKDTDKNKDKDKEKDKGKDKEKKKEEQEKKKEERATNPRIIKKD